LEKKTNRLLNQFYHGKINIESGAITGTGSLILPVMKEETTKKIIAD
jgi:hypothetical protein